MRHVYSSQIAYFTDWFDGSSIHRSAVPQREHPLIK